MAPGEEQVNQTVSIARPGSGLVRWISVVTLGCSLGLLIVFIVLSARIIPVPAPGVPVAYHIPQKEIPFKLSEEPVEKELTRVIESQLAAFRNEDYPQAYTFAAAAIRTHMPLPDFERMVKSGFPVIAQSRSAQFGVILDNGEQAVVNTTVFGPTGRARHYQYILLRERSGWKIAGVTEVKAAGTTI